ncbi:hypothetical protein FACS189459_6830 [Bacilli bacterium]|nr:hypothetical protein FACS189459_6830 [Bacilli bacterium]
MLNKYKFKIKKTTITKWTFIGGAVFLIIINIIKLVWGIFFVSSIPSVPAPYWNAWRYEVVVPLQYCSLFPIVYLLSAFVDRKKIFYDFSIIFGLIASISFIVDPIMFMNESVAIVLGRASGTYTPFQYAYSLCCIMYHCGYVFITATLIVFQIKKISFKSIG